MQNINKILFILRKFYQIDFKALVITKELLFEMERIDEALTQAAMSGEQETLDAAFEPFERLGQETGTTSGVGIGLPLARTFAEAMGGRIVIEKAVIEGSRVHVIVPRAPAQ